MIPAVRFSDVDIITGDRAAEGLHLLDKGATRSEILEKTGAVLDCAGVKLTVGEGEICVLMGLPGSGQAALLRAVNGLVRPARGKVLVKDGENAVDVASCDEATLRRMRQERTAMVFQQGGLMPWLTVAENIGFGLELAGMPDTKRVERVTRQIKLLNLEAWAGRRVGEVPPAIAQRAGLARAFATEAPIVLLDDPFSSLDAPDRADLEDELLAFQKKVNKTMICASRNLEEALKLGSHIAIFEEGRIVQTGRPEDILLRPVSAYVRDFVASVNPLKALTAQTVMRDARDLEAAGDGWVWLDRRKTTRFKIGADRKIEAAERDKKKAVWIAWEDAEKPLEPKTKPVFWATPRVPLATVLLAMNRADTAPVALLDEEERLIGAVCVHDALQAVLRRALS